MPIWLLTYSTVAEPVSLLGVSIGILLISWELISNWLLVLKLLCLGYGWTRQAASVEELTEPHLLQVQEQVAGLLNYLIKIEPRARGSHRTYTRMVCPKISPFTEFLSTYCLSMCHATHGANMGHIAMQEINLWNLYFLIMPKFTSNRFSWCLSVLREPSTTWGGERMFPVSKEVDCSWTTSHFQLSCQCRSFKLMIWLVSLM